MATITTANVYAGVSGRIVFLDKEATQPRDYAYTKGDLIGLSYLVTEKNSKGETMYQVNIGGKAVIRTDANGRTITEITRGASEAWVKEKDAVFDKTTREVNRGGRDTQSNNSGGGDGDNNSGLFLLAGVAVVGLVLKFLPKKEKKR